MMPKNESTCAEKRENDAENERKRMAYEKTEMLYFKVKIGSISLEKHTHPLQIDSFTENKNDLSDVRK